MKNLRKALIISVMFAMVLSMGMTVVAPKANAASGGDLIKMDGLSSVYYLGTDGKRYVFPNENTYFSWYSDFSTVVTIAQSELESYPLGANVTMRPGNKLVKITTDPKVYAVEPGGNLVHVPSEDVASTLWGSNWARRVVDVPDAFFTNYTVTADTVSAGAYPAGSLVKWEGAADVYFIEEDGTARKIQDEAAFTANKFKWDDIVVATIAMPSAGTAITAFDVNLFDPSDGAGGVPGAGTGLTVSLASDTPASMNIPEGSPAEFLKFNVTASADGDVSVTGFTFKAYDLGGATNITNVTTYVNGTKIGTAKNMTSDRIATITYSNPLLVEAGQSKTVVVKATLGASAATANYSIGLAATASVSTNGAVVSGSFPIVGNSMAAVDGGTIGTITLSSVDGTDTSGVQFGEDNVLLGEFTLTAANEAVIWETARLRNGGTSNDIVENVKIFVDGVEVATGIWDGDYVNFAMNNYEIAKGDNVSAEIYGDFGTGNTSDSVVLYVKEATDFSFVGKEFGYGLQMAGFADWDTTTEGKTITVAAGDFTIDMDKAATPAKDVKPGTDNVVLATFKMTSAGENATVDSIVNDAGNGTFYITGTNPGLVAASEEITNVEMVDSSNGAIYAITATASTTLPGWTLSMTDEISLAKGVTKTFQIRADISGSNDSDTMELNDTLQVVVEADAITVTGDTSNASLAITPTSVSSAVTTIKTASLTWTTTSLSAKTVVPGATDVVVYRASLKAGAASDVKLSSVQINNQGAGTSFDDAYISQLVLKLNGKVLATKSNYISSDGVDAYVNFNSLTTDNVIPKGQTYTLEVLASFPGSFSATDAFALGIDDSAAMIIVRNDDNDAFAETLANAAATSNIITLATTGTLKVELKDDDVKADVDTYLLAGSETTAGRYMGKLVFTTENEAVKVKTLALGNAGADSGSDDILAVRLYDKDGVMVAQEGVSTGGHVYFDSLNLIMPADQATSYFIGIVAKSMNADGDAEGTADYQATVAYRLATSTDRTALDISSTVTAEGVDSSETITLTESADATPADNEYEGTIYTTKSVDIVGSVLTSIVNDMTDGVLTAGNSKTIGKYKFTFNNGNNRTTTNEELMAQLQTLILNISTSTGVVVSNVEAYIDGNSANKTTPVSVVNGEATISLLTLDGETSEVDGTVTLVITANITGVETSDMVQTEIDNLTSDFVYDGSGEDTGNLSGVRLDYTEVIGATLSN